MKAACSILFGLFLAEALASAPPQAVLRTAAETASVIFGKTFVDAPFDFVAKATYVRHKDWLATTAIAVEDASGAVILHKTGPISFLPRPGDTIRIKGVTAMLHFPQAGAFFNEITLVSHGTAVAVRPSTIGEILSGRLDCRLVSVVATVRDIFPCELNPQWTILVLAGNGNLLYASVPTHDDDNVRLEALIGSTVSAVGVTVPSDLSNRNQIGRTFKIADLMMPGMDGVETTRRLIKDDPNNHILILTTFGTSDGISHALEAGAPGAMLKNADISELATAIRAVAHGKRSVSRELERIMTEDPPVDSLSPRQLEILGSLVRGLTSVDIAKKLRISSDMVREHTSALFRKLGAANRAEAVAIALRKHLLKT